MDIDGVIWRGGIIVPGVRELISHAVNLRYRVGFLTNSSNRSRAYICERLTEFGIEADPEQVYTASHVTALYVASLGRSGCVYVTVGGGEALLAELRDAGLQTGTLRETSLSPKDRCSIVTGHTVGFGYDDASRVLRLAAIVEDIFASERDRWYATPDGPLPSSAWFIAAIEELVGKPAITIGKPNGRALATVAKALSVDPGEILMVGDSRQVDVAAAHNAGSLSCQFDDPAIRRLYEGLDDGPEPNFTVSSMGELASLLDNLSPVSRSN